MRPSGDRPPGRPRCPKPALSATSPWPGNRRGQERDRRTAARVSDTRDGRLSSGRARTARRRPAPAARPASAGCPVAGESRGTQARCGVQGRLPGRRRPERRVTAGNGRAVSRAISRDRESRGTRRASRTRRACPRDRVTVACHLRWPGRGRVSERAPSAAARMPPNGRRPGVDRTLRNAHRARPSARPCHADETGGRSRPVTLAEARKRPPGTIGGAGRARPWHPDGRTADHRARSVPNRAPAGPGASDAAPRAPRVKRSRGAGPGRCCVPRVAARGRMFRRPRPIRSRHRPRRAWRGDCPSRRKTGRRSGWCRCRPPPGPSRSGRGRCPRPDWSG